MGIYKIINEETQKLFEIGEGEKYPWHKEVVGDDKEYGYSFKTEDNDTYMVFMGIAWHDDEYADDYGEPYWSIDFKTKDGEFGDVLNKGRHLKVFTTIVDICTDFFNTEKPANVIISPWGSAGYDWRRYRIYVELMKRNLPQGYKMLAGEDGKIYASNPEYQARYHEQPINEVGEGGHTAYQWRPTRQDKYNYDYEFQTPDGDDYEVVFMDVGNYWNVDFKTKTGKFEDVLDKGRFFEVMATVGEVIKDFLIKEQPELTRISPAKNSNDDQRRFNVYNLFISKQLPRGYETRTKDGLIYIMKADEEDQQIAAEGTGDAYAQNKFGIADPEDTYRSDTQAGVQDPENGELIGYTRGEYVKHTRNFTSDKGSPIYKNPRSLRNFDNYVRALSDAEGNLYVGQINSDYMHGAMEHGIKKGASAYDIDWGVTWQRVAGTNKFGLADSSSGYPHIKRTMELFSKHLDAVRRLNPQFEFHAEYYYDLTEVITEEVLGFNEAYSSYEDKQDFEKQYQQYQKTSNTDPANGELAGHVISNNPSGESSVPIFKNPRSLKNFEADVRAIGDSRGNIYVAQLNGGFLHENMGRNIGVRGIEFYRVGDKNFFGISGSLTRQMRSQGLIDNESDEWQISEGVLDMIRMLNKNNPMSFSFLPQVALIHGEYSQQQIERSIPRYQETKAVAANNMEHFEEGLDERQDVEKIDEVNTLKKEVDDKLRNKDFHEIKRTEDRSGLLIAIIHVPRDQHVLEISFTNIIKRGTSGDYGVDDNNNNNPFINLFDCDIIDDGGNNVEVYYTENTLSHELRHYLDWQRGDDVFAQKYNTADGDKSSYYNNPAEYNAFMIQYLRQYFNQFGIRYIEDDFNLFYNGLVNHTKIDEFKYKLNPDMRKKFMNRLYAFHQRLIEERDKQYPPKAVAEGVGDAYAEKKWGIPNPETGYQSQTQAAMRSQENGELAGYALDTSYDRKEQDTRNPVYKNPKTLRNFEAEVRAVTDTRGNLWVGQTNGNYLHGDMRSAVGIPDVYDVRNGLTWIRMANTNKFGLADSAATYLRLIQAHQDDRMLKVFNQNLEAANQSNQAFEFVPELHDAMQEDLNDIVAEEAQALVEGYGSYDEKQQWEKQYQDHLKARSQTTENGELVNRLVDDNQEVINIFRNPRSLRNFGTAVRAISDAQGNLFVGQFDKEYLHADMAEQIGIPANRYVPWHRLSDTNKFNSVDAGRVEDLNVYFDAVRNAHQQFEFHVMDLQQQGQIEEVEDNCNHHPDEMPS